MKTKLFLLFLVPFIGFAQENDTVKQNFTNKYGIYDTDLLSKEFHANRREALRELMPDNSVAVFFANPIRNRSNDVDYEYHQDPNFYYFTGLTEPHAMLIVFKEPSKINGEKHKEYLFVQNRNEEAEVWTGKRLGTEGVKEELGIEGVNINVNYKADFLDLSKFKGGVHFSKLPEDVRKARQKGTLYELLSEFEKALANEDISTDTKSIQEWTAQLRQDKQPEELVLLKKAIDITCEAHNENMRVLKPNSPEYQTEAVVEYIFKKNGAEYTGFPSIIGSGENSCILHYTTSRKTVFENELVVCDIGAEYHGYTADVTRTLPVNGKFSEEQKIIYNIVYEAQQAGIDSCKAGNSFWSAHIAATTIISQRLKDLGIISRPQEVRQYFMHGTSHYLGLDVHDTGLYGKLKVNDVLTVEPGIYIPAGSPCDEKWWNIGVRIEDDILITENGPVNLSTASPRKAEDIEAMMQEEPLIFKE